MSINTSISGITQAHPIRPIAPVPRRPGVAGGPDASQAREAQRPATAKSVKAGTGASTPTAQTYNAQGVAGKPATPGLIAAA